jgi:hypothetical protein
MENKKSNPVADQLFEATKPTDIVIFGSNMATSFEITDDYSSFNLTVNDKIVKFPCGDWETSSIDSDGFVSILTLSDFLENLKDNEEFPIDGIGDAVDAVLLKNYKGVIELKVKIEDENGNIRWVEQGELNSDYINHQFGDDDVDIYVNINDNCATLLDKEKIEQLTLVQERKDKMEKLEEKEEIIDKDKDSKIFLDVVRKTMIDSMEEDEPFEDYSWISDFVGNITRATSIKMPPGLRDIDGWDEKDLIEEYGENYKDKLVDTEYGKCVEDEDDPMDLENCDIYGVDETYVCIWGGGDWQNPQTINIGVENGEWFIKREDNSNDNRIMEVAFGIPRSDEDNYTAEDLKKLMLVNERKDKIENLDKKVDSIGEQLSKLDENIDKLIESKTEKNVFKTDIPKDVIILGTPIDENETFIITDDEANFYISENNNIIEFDYGWCKNKIQSSIGCCSVVEFDELLNSEYIDDPDFEACLEDGFAPVFLIKDFVGEINLKIKDYNNKSFKDVSNLSLANIQNQIEGEIILDIKRKDNDSSNDVEMIMDINKINQYKKVNERKDKMENLESNVRVKAYKGDGVVLIPPTEDFYVYLPGDYISKVLKDLTFKVYPFDKMRVDFINNEDKEYFEDNFNSKRFTKEIKEHYGEYEFPSELMDKYNVDCEACIVMPKDEYDEELDDNPTNKAIPVTIDNPTPSGGCGCGCSCQEDDDCGDDCECDDEDQMMKDMMDKMEQAQKDTMKYQNTYLVHIQDTPMGKIAYLVHKPYWDKNKGLDYELWFNPSSDLGIKLKMVGINPVELQESIYEVMDQDLTIEDIVDNLKQEDIFEVNQEFSDWVDGGCQVDTTEDTEDTSTEVATINKENVIDSVTTNLGDTTKIGEMSAEDIAKLEKEVSDKMVVRGKKVNAKVDVNGVKQRPVKYEELKDLIKNQIENNFKLYFWAKDEENEGQTLEVKSFKGKKLMSTNLDDDEVMIWLDTKTDLPFSVDFSKDPKGDLVSLVDEGDTFTLTMEDKAILIHVEEQMAETMDLRSDEKFQEFLKKIKIYDQDRFKVNIIAKDYSEEDLTHWIERMSEVGYIYSKGKFQDTGKDEDDYFYTVTNKFLRTRKFGFLDLNNDEVEEEIVVDDDEEYFEID